MAKRTTARQARQITGRNRHTGDAYLPEFAEQARLCCGRHGFIVKELCELFGVVRQTIYNWMERHPEFKEAIEAGRDDSKDALRASMFRRSCGYEYWEEEWALDSKTGKMRLTKKFKRHLPADKTMAIYLSQNWMPHEFKDRQQIDHMHNIPPSVINIITANGQQQREADGSDESTTA